MYSAGCGNYSRLESMVSYSAGNRGYTQSKLDYLVAAEPKSFNPMPVYNTESIKKEVYADNYRQDKRVSQSYSTCIDDFLNPARPLTSFIGKASEIKDMVEETFQKLTGKDFPDDVAIRIVSAQEMEKMHPTNVLGFAINRKHLGLMSEIFIKENMLEKVMLTLGHELGHVLTRRLQDDRDEEAKAFAFSLAWMKTIKENNIGNLSTSISLDAPARNGLHDVALDFVLRLIKEGREAINVWMDIIKGESRVMENVCIWS